MVHFSLSLVLGFIITGTLSEAHYVKSSPNKRHYTDSTGCLSAPSCSPLRILPLGDSITYGYGEASGNSYRRNLQCSLHSLDFPTQLIGSIKNGDWPNNESDGFVLNTLPQIQANSTPEIQATSGPPPNVVLVHAGTVDLVFDVNVTTAPQRLKDLVVGIHTALPDALVVVSQVIPNANVSVQPRIDAYNAEVPGVVGEIRKEGAGEKVVLTGMPDVTVADLLDDGTHPNEVGYAKMARNWLLAVLSAYVKGSIVPAEGTFVDLGETSEIPGGGC